VTSSHINSKVLYGVELEVIRSTFILLKCWSWHE